MGMTKAPEDQLVRQISCRCGAVNMPRTEYNFLSSAKRAAFDERIRACSACGTS